MNCTNCGHQNTAGATVCEQCGAALAVPPPAPPMSMGPATPPPQATAPAASGPPAPVPNHLVWAIISTVVATLVSIVACCCVPLGLAPGIPAIVYANKVNTLMAVEDYAGARDASEKAKIWSLVTTVFGAAILLLWMVSLALQLSGVLDEDYLEQLIR